MSTKLTELRDGCFHSALDDEPMFVLLARDPSAPAQVREWAGRRKLQIDRGERPASDMSKVTAAIKTADDMENWRLTNDGAWHCGLFELPEIRIQMSTQYIGRAIRHAIRQESDEYACSCGMRWDVIEGEEHP